MRKSGRLYDGRRSLAAFVSSSRVVGLVVLCRLAMDACNSVSRLLGLTVFDSFISLLPRVPSRWKARGVHARRSQLYFLNCCRHVAQFPCERTTIPCFLPASIVSHALREELRTLSTGLDFSRAASHKVGTTNARAQRNAFRVCNWGSFAIQLLNSIPQHEIMDTITQHQPDVCVTRNRYDSATTCQ